MKKRLLSWLLVLTMVTSLIPSTLVTALAAELPSVQAATSTNGKTTLKLTNTWPTNEQLAQNDIVDVSITSSVAPGATVTVKDGQTLIFHGTGFLVDSSTNLTPLVVESGGHLVLDELTIQNNGVASTGAVYVKSGGLLDLGYNDRSSRHAPSITGNTTANAARNLVIAEGATVRLNAEATKRIGIYYGNDLGVPFAIVQSGRYTLQNTDLSDAAIYSDHADYVLSINYGDIYVTRKTPKVLFIDPGARATETINGIVGQGNYVFRANSGASTLIANLRIAVQDTFRGIHNATIKNPLNATVDYKEYQSSPGTDYKNGTYSFDDINNIMQYDVIFVNGAWGNLTADGRKKLIDYLNAGGCIYFQAEDTQAGFDGVRAATNVWMQDLGATGFAAMGSPSGAGTLNAWKDKSTDYAKRLTENMPDKWHVDWTAPIKTGAGIEPVFWATFVDGSQNMWAASYLAGEREDGAKYGRLIAITDGNWVAPASGKDINYCGNIAGQFFTNLLRTTRENRITAAADYNPNAEITYEATTTTTKVGDYRTPYAALQKAVENNTVTLLTKKNTAVTPVSNELLFEQSTLAYEQGSKYDGSTIHADTAGVYLDITKTGEVNLQSGTVTVTPKDKNYVLTMNGTMDDAGTQITGGYKITASNKYTLDADDETSKIPAAQGGGASITLANKDDSVTVEYGAPINKTVTYTAQEANEKIYLGYYRVDKNVGSNVTWTDADYAWHGQTFTTTAAGNAGWELNGEQLTVADKEGTVVGNYVLTKTGTETDGGNSWTVYTSKEKGRDGTPKVTVKQQHLGGDADRNGEIKVIVSDVRGDVTIAAAGDVVSASAAFVYVVGVGRKNGAETQLWEYTTVRNSKDGLTQKPINGWPWEKWKVVEAGSALGGQTDYQNKTDKFTNSFTKDPTKLDTTNATAKYTIDLTQGDQVVVFYYDWNMTEVTIKATDANGKPIPDYTDQVVEYESNKETTITAPNLIGYQPVHGENTKDFIPSETNKEITFQYEKTTGNLIYKAVYVDGAGVTHNLGTFSGGTLVKGQAPNKAGTAAPTFDNYELVDASADGTATSAGDATKFDGTNDITVTYKYQPKTKNIAVYAYVGDESGQILNLDKTSYKGITTGQTITVTAPEIAGYKVKGDASKTFFISNNKSENQDVKFFYEKDTSNDAYVLVKLVDSSNGDKIISSYTVPGVKDKAQLIKAPAAPYGYKNDPNHTNEDQTVTPTGTQAPYKAEVVFKYVPNVHTVTIELKDVSETPAKTLTVNNYVTSYKVVDREGLTITAPSIYGYTMAQNSESVKVLSNITEDKTVTFEYEPIDKQMVYIHVKGVGPDNNTLFESRESVTHGTASKEVNVFTLPGLKLASATVGSVDKTNEVANGKLTVNLTSVTKGGIVEVLLTYESNMADVTVKAMYNGTELQSYTTSLEKGITATINAPSVPGYTATPSIKTVKPGDDPTANTVTFTYTKDNGNVTVVVVDKDGNKELYRKDGGTVARGTNIVLTGKAEAPTIEYYKTPTAPKNVLVGSTEVKDLTNYKYDGVGDIIVTYEYTRKTQDVTIIKRDEDTKTEITRETLQSLPVGKSHTFADGSVAVPNNYQAVTDRNPTSYFVEDKAGQTVTFWYKNTSADQYAQIKVNLICGGKVFQSYPVTAIKGQPTTIQAPTWTGYELKAGTKVSATVTPNGTEANDTVEFEYTIKDPKTVTVVLKDNSNSTNPKLNAPANYIDSYTLKMGDNVTIWAPAIDGYSLVSATLGDKASDNKQMVQAEYGKLADGTTTVTFAYMPVSQANFVTHTVRFMLGDKELYSYDKKVDKGTGNVVSYPADAVKSMIPGYTYDHTSYLINGVTAQAGDVKDNVNATIIYHFAEDTARITIKFQDASGNELMQNGVKVPDQELTGYRKGQTVQVAAPVKEGFALVSDLIQKVTLNDANTDVAFKYAAAGDVTFTLKELNADGTEGSIIAVINGEASKTYDANAKDGNPLDLSQYGYTYEPSNLATEPFKVGGSGKVENPDMSKKTAYTVFYTKNLITVEFVPVNKTELDKANKNLDTAIADGTAYTTYKITELHPETPEKARVGETYKAVAQSFNGWALKDSYSKQYKVEAGDTYLKVYFLYEQKTTGTVTVHYHFGTGADNMGEKLNEYTITAVAGEKLKISAPEYLLDNKYHLRTTNTNPCILTVTENTETVDFYYEANFVTITTKVNLDGTDTGTHETYEVIKNIDTHSGSTTLYPPEKAGYTLIGITADGATLTNGGADKLPTQYTNNKLALTSLTQNATVTYYYKTTKASEYQTALTVEYKYNGYDLAKAKTINANTGEANSIDIPAFDGYTASTYNFKDGSTVKVTGSGVNGTTVSVTPAEKTATLTITYTRPDGSIVLPGKNDKFGDSDDIIVKPTDPNTPPTLNPDNGSVTIPKDPAGNTGTVTRPKDPTKPDDGKEDIIVPGGTTIDKDGTIHLPDSAGTITPDQKIPDALTGDYIAITYDSNNGSGDVKKEIGKKGELKVAGSLFTHPTNAKFEGWNDSGLGSGTAYAKDKTVNTSITLYAKWSANYKYHATITYKPNDGTTGKDVLQNVGHDTDPNLKATLQSNTFQISGWLFGGWNEEANGTGELRQSNDTWNLSDKDAKTLYAQWYKVNADGSITVPGKDGNPKNEDTNATAKGNGTDAPTRNDKGEIEVPKGGSVTLPDGSVIGMPDGGKLLPNGTVVINRPDKDGNGKTDDGTITIPGKTDPTKPDVTDKDGRPEADAKVIELVYQINDGKSHDEVTVKVVKGDTVSILDCPFTWAGHQFVNWMGTDNKEYAAGANYTAGDNDLELHAQWVKVNDDGSIELPGKDGSMTTPKDNVLVTPDNPPVGNLDKKNDGSVEVKGDGATVNRPKDPTHPEQGKENIKVPEGTIVKPDGTIILPNNGGTINPDGKLPGATPTGYISVVYKANGGTGDDVIDLIKNDQTINARTNPFTNGNQTFNGWNTVENGVGGTAYQAGAEITIPNSSNTITLYAQWGKAEYKHTAKITYQANDGVTNAIEDTVGANDSTKFSTNLRSNPFSVSGWDFGGWNTEANGTGTLKAANAVVEVEAGKNQTWYAQWYKVGANGSITVPGDGNPNTEGDNVTANGNGVTRDTTTGNIEIPAGGNAVKGNGETIALPNGGTLKPDGTLIIDKPNGGQIEVKPDGSTDPNANVVTLTYEANNGTNDTRKVYTTKGEAIAPLAADTFSYSGHAFLYWKSGDTIFKTNGTITPTDAMTLSAVWAKVNPDGSIELPGTDGKLEAPDNEDNVIVTPDKPGGKVTPQPDGSVKVEDKDGTVTRPTDPKHPESGKEEIKVPEGTVVEPDGTIKLPDNTTINPDQRIPDDVTPADYYVVTYEPGDGSGDVIRQIIAKDTDTTLLGADTFTAPNGKTFDGWLDEDQNAHDAGDPLTVDKSMTFTAKWKDGTPTPPAQDYSAEIVFDPNTGDATATQTISSDSETITRNLDPYTQHFTVPTDWTFMGWSTTKAASQSSTFYEDGEKVTLKNGKTLNLYAIVYKVDADTGVITLPGKGGQPNDGDDVTVTPGAGSALTPDKGFIKAPAGSEIKQPGNENPIKVIEGEVNVYPDGSVFVPEGSKVQLPDGTEVDGEATIDPDGNPDTDNTKPIQRPDGTIVLPGENGKTGDPDDITIAPAGPNQPAGRIDEDGNVTITDPDGADVNLPGNTPEDIKVPNGTVIKPNGDMTLLYTIRYVDGSDTEIKTATVKSVRRGISATVDASTITGYTVSGEATKTASGEVSANLADYTITFTYTKNSSGGGSSGGGGGSSSGGGSVSSSFVIKASAGNGGNISPSGNVTVKRGEDQSFHINPINGYRISDVIVDGKSVGAVSTYTFDSVKANHTIQVKFVKHNSIVADPEVTGVAGWLQTKEHNGYMGGYGNGLFGPNDNMTRAQAAQMFYNLLLNKDVDITVNFTDVPADAWYGKAVHTLASLGIIAGIGNNQFAPNRTITRAEFTVIAQRFANLAADVTNPFSDVSENDWFYTAVTSAVSYGWINGYSDGSFRPQATITRAEVVTIVNRMLNRTADRNFVDSNVTAQFDDVPNTYWAYYNIMEATIAHDHSIDNDGVESWGKQK